MFGKNDHQQLTQSIYQDLINRLLKEKEENEALKAKNQALEQEVSTQKSRITSLESKVLQLEQAQERILGASMRMGIDLSWLKNIDDHYIWIGRTVPYLASIVRPVLETVRLPHFEEARHIDALSAFMDELPGYGIEEFHTETEKHYEYMRMGATQFLPHTQGK